MRLPISATIRVYRRKQTDGLSWAMTTPWVADLASALGLPVGAATLAVAIYAACAAAEKVARPTALEDMARFLREPAWSHSFRSSAMVDRIFRWTFGDRHLSWKCLRRSLLATTIMVSVLAATTSRVARDAIALADQVGWGVLVPELLVWGVLIGMIPDNIALWKTRLLIARMARNDVNPILLPAIDVCLSALISAISLSIFITIAIWQLGVWGQHGPFDLSVYLNVLGTGLAEAGRFFIVPSQHGDLYAVCMVSTIFTSIWTVLILLSSTLIRLVIPLQALINWFYPVEKHPMKAIGLVSAALTMIVALLSSGVRALF
jgi:hypothetical protein